MHGEPANTEAIIKKHRRSWRTTSFLSNIPHQLIAEFCEAGLLSHFDRDTILIEEGDHDQAVFLLLTGCVKVTARLDDGRTALLAVRAGGDVVGELAVVDGHQRSATVTTCSPTTTISLASPDFAQLITRHAPAWRTLMAAISGKFRAAIRRQMDYTGTSPDLSCG